MLCILLYDSYSFVFLSFLSFCFSILNFLGPRYKSINQIECIWSYAFPNILNCHDWRNNNYVWYLFVKYGNENWFLFVFGGKFDVECVLHVIQYLSKKKKNCLNDEVILLFKSENIHAVLDNRPSFIISSKIITVSAQILIEQWWFQLIKIFLYGFCYAWKI